MPGNDPAAQSQPAATVQEVPGWFRYALKAAKESGRDLLLERKDIDAILAALTAEPAAKAGDACAPDAIRIAYKTGYNEGYEDAGGNVDHDAAEEGWQQYLEANPPSPQPDMGSTSTEASRGKGGC